MKYNNKKITRILEIQSEHDLDFSFGLAPYPFGFCFSDTNKTMTKQEKIELSNLINELTEKESDILRKVLFD